MQSQFGLETIPLSKDILCALAKVWLPSDRPLCAHREDEKR